MKRVALLSVVTVRVQGKITDSSAALLISWEAQGAAAQTMHTRQFDLCCDVSPCSF